MTNSAAMTLTLVVFIVLLLAAIVVIFGGGVLFARRDRPQSPRPRRLEDHRRRAA